MINYMAGLAQMLTVSFMYDYLYGRSGSDVDCYVHVCRLVLEYSLGNLHDHLIK